MDMKTVGEVAKRFKEAVESKINLKETADIAKKSKIFGLLASATEDELYILLGANLDIDKNGVIAEKRELSDKDLIRVADVYANLAERQCISKELEDFIPENEEPKEIITVLSNIAPSFAKLFAAKHCK